jgi:CHAT domain-containing protein/tetratricopeptide (TPR) repeat protein
MTDRTPPRGPDRRLPGLACLLLLLVATALPGEAPGPACQLLGGDCALIHKAMADNRLADVATLAERALAVAETSSTDPLAAAQAIDVLVPVRCTLGRGRETRTVELAERAVAIRTREQGESHPDLIESLHNLARVLRHTGDFKRAWKLTEQALGLAEVRFGPDHAVTVHCVNELSAVQTATGDAASGMVSAQRALGLAEKIQPEDRLLVAESLNALAAARFQRGDAAGSVALFRRALGLREAALGPNHPLLARSAMNLGMALRATGERDEGERMLRRALGIFGRVAPNHPDTLLCFNSLALIARSRGDYVEARRLWERALEVGESAFGEEHPTVAGVLNNLATLRKLMGDYPAAQALLERSLAIRERVRGPDHPEVAQALVNLATVQMMTRQYAQARASAERAVAIREKAFGPDTAQVGLSLATLGEVLGQAGDLDGARVAYERAVASLDQPGAAGGQDLATALLGLAAVRHQDGELGEAAGLYERALMLEEQNLDPTHPLVGEVLVRLGLLTAQRGDFETAMRMALRAETNARDHLQLTCRYLSEREGVAYAVTRAKGLDLALSLVAARPEASDVAQVFTALMRSRTLVLDEAIARNQRLNHPVDPALATLHDDVTAAANELVIQLVRGPGKEGPEQYKSGLAAARERVERAERAVAEHTVGAMPADAATTWLQVRDALPASSALVAFARYKQEPVTGPVGSAAVPSYLAFVLTSLNAGPVVVPLGPAAEIEGLVKEWETLVARGYAREARQAVEAEASCRVAGQKARRAIWDPIATRIGRAETVFVVPEGALHLVHLDALPREEGGYLIESRPAIHQLTAEKDLLFAPREGAGGEGLLAMGGAAFDRRAAERRAGAEPPTQVRSLTDRPVCPEFQTVHFAPLPNTDAEAKEVGRLFRRAEASRVAGTMAVVLRGSQATEASFRKLAPGKRILHLATHGFFLGEHCRPAEPASRGIGGLVSTTEMTPAPRTMDSPLRLAGLALAGANQRATASATGDDGILTAEEIGLLDLGGVEWAVLSACDSGTGTVAIGEGVLGLRRAFLIAGARSVIMSLWAVDDAAGREWMGALYEARLGRGLSTADSVREASLEMLQQRRARGLTTHPFYWAAFVAAGDWR